MVYLSGVTQPITLGCFLLMAKSLCYGEVRFERENDNPNGMSKTLKSYHIDDMKTIAYVLLTSYLPAR